MDEGRVLTVDPAVLGHDARLDLLESLERLQGVVDVQRQRTLAALAGSDDRVEQWVREEVSVVLRISPQTAGARLRLAQDLTVRLPATLAAVGSGRVTLNHARALVDAVDGLPEAAVGAVQERVLARARGKSVAEFRAHCRRAALAADPRGAQERHVAAAGQRSVSFSPEVHGMASIQAFLPAQDVAVIRQRVEACAATLGSAGDADDSRTADQQRADVFADLLAGRDVTTGVPQPVQVIASMATLRGLSDEPGELDGEPVTAGVVRALATTTDAFWRPVLIDDGTGALIAAGAHTYRPGARLRRLIRLRDRTCRFPGCRRRAVRTDIDHIKKFSIDGDTVPENLHCLCRRHHRLKDEDTGWFVWRGSDGVTRWLSPTNRRYDKPPDPYPGATPEPAAATAHDPPPY